MDVYFISGMSANCKVFDRIVLPEGFTKKYIEWVNPSIDESLDSFVRRMAESIDVDSPFMLFGYSLGGIIVQEMNKFLMPEKTIIIASIKSNKETSPLMRLGQKIHFADKIPMSLVTQKGIIADLFTRFVYHIDPKEANEYISYTDPVYTKWCLTQLLNWKPTIACSNLYHIHGTKDQMFPSKYINDAYFMQGADHLLVMKKYRQVNQLLTDILLEPKVV